MTNKATAINSDDIDNYYPGKLEKEEKFKGLMFNIFEPFSARETTYIPSSSDHVLVLINNGCMKGHVSFNGERSSRFDQHDGEWVLSQSFENSIEGNWQRCPISQLRMTTSILCLQPEFLKTVAHEVADFAPGCIELPHKRGFRDPFLYQLTLQIQLELHERKMFGKLFMETAVTMLGIHILRHYSAKKARVAEPGKKPSSKSIQRAVDYIHSSLDKPLSLKKLALEANMSSYHFARVFKEIIGCPPHQYVVNVKIQKAKDLLKNRKMPIGLIALELGYNINHFSQVFRRYTGASPREFRGLTRTD
ncbi:MAG: AraC family transcriptional regulator [Reinekea sp.]|jgi:AraC family transcriptional regulator